MFYQSVSKFFINVFHQSVSKIFIKVFQSFSPLCFIREFYQSVWSMCFINKFHQSVSSMCFNQFHFNTFKFIIRHKYIYIDRLVYNEVIWNCTKVIGKRSCDATMITPSRVTLAIVTPSRVTQSDFRNGWWKNSEKSACRMHNFLPSKCTCIRCWLVASVVTIV